MQGEVLDLLLDAYVQADAVDEGLPYFRKLGKESWARETLEKRSP